MSILAKRQSGGRPLWKRVAAKLHLWLGLASGLVMVVVCLTGSVYVFEREIRDLTEPYRFVNVQESGYAFPSVLQATASKVLGEKEVIQVEYPAPDRAAIVAQWDKAGYWLVYLNPYTAEVLKVKDMDRDFLRWVIEGHVGLWIPGIGRQIVAWSTLVFVLLLLTGMVLWWPKSSKKKVLKNALFIKKGSGKRKLTFDLHNVLGAYSFTFLLVIALTGLVWGFEWFAKGSYWLTSGGKQTLPEWEMLTSDSSLATERPSIPAVDRLWLSQAKHSNASKAALSVSFPNNSTDVITVTFQRNQKLQYRNEVRFFDQYSLKELKGNSLQALTFEQSDGAQKLRKLNLDLHTGAALGLAGKLLAFMASLIGASLPITGFLIWWRKKKN